MFIKKLLFIVASSIVLSACSSSDPINPDSAANDVSGAGNTVPDNTPTNNGSTDTGSGETPDAGAGSNNSGSPETPPGTPNTDNSNPNGGTFTQGAISGNITLWGYVAVNNAAPGFDIDISAGFNQFNLPAPAADIAANIALPTDSCTVSVTALSGAGGFNESASIPSVGNTNFTPVSAGDAIVFTSPAGTFAELQPSTFAGITAYLPIVDSIPSPLPQSLTMDIPGDAFPAFSNIPIPSLESISLSSPAADSQWTSDVSFQWQPSAQTDDVAIITAAVLDIQTFSSTSVSCYATDDGEFSFPAATRAEIGTTFENAIPTVSAQRFSLQTYQSGNAILLVQSSSF